MTTFSQTITAYWRAAFLSGDILYSDEAFSVAINPSLSEDRRLMVLNADDRIMAVLTPALASKLGIHKRKGLSESTFRRELSEVGNHSA